MKYHQAYDGDHIRPKMKGYKVACCDCGLVHKFNFYVQLPLKRGKKPSKAFVTLLNKTLGKPEITYKVWRDERATAGIRRGKKHKGLRLGKGKRK